MSVPGIDRRALLKGMAATPLLLSGGSALARGEDLATPVLDEMRLPVVITANEISFRMPARIPAGMTTLMLVNAGQTDHAAQLLRLDADALIPDITAALRDGLSAISPFASMAGGPGHTPPGGQQTVIQDLSPGHYMVIDTAPGPDGIPHFVSEIVRPFQVVERDGDASAERPARDHAVELMDFSFFGLPREIPAVEQVWHVSNHGTEAHELGFRRLDDGVTAEEVIEMVTASASGTPPAEDPFAALRMVASLPMTSAGGIQAMAPGENGWLVVDLEPGEYLAISMMPTVANGGALQAQLGMIQGFTVLEP